MKSCKLAYMTKNLNSVSKKRLMFLIDKDSLFDFHQHYIDKLKSCKDNEELKVKYQEIFREINKICIDNDTCPIFKDPVDIVECLKIRKEVLRSYDEEELNDFFDVDSFYDYNPLKYIKPISYPAILEKDEEVGWNVTVPDIFGGVTCGDDYEDAILMAKDMIKLMLLEAPGQCFPPKTFEETQNNFPNDLVVMIEVDLN